MMEDFVHDGNDDEGRTLQHEALNQLDEWRAEARETVESNPVDHGARHVDELPALIDAELVRAHRSEIEELLEKLKRDKADLEAQMESDSVNEVRPTQADLDELDALTDAISQIEDLLDANPL